MIVADEIVIICHPHKDSLSFGILDVVLESISRKRTHEVVDLYRYPVGSIVSAEEMTAYNDGIPFEDTWDLLERLRLASSLTMIFPVWMYGMPARLKGVLERIVRPDITFRIASAGVEPLLTNIEHVNVICTSGQRKPHDLNYVDCLEVDVKRFVADNIGPSASLFYCRIWGLDHAARADVDARLDDLRVSLLHR